MVCLLIHSNGRRPQDTRFNNNFTTDTRLAIEDIRLNLQLRTSHRLKIPLPGLLIAGFLSAAIGCGSSSGEPLASVAGKVTQNGQPLSGAIVMFVPESGSGGPSGGETDANGDFQLKYSTGETGATIGKHRVVITIPGTEAPAPMGGETKPVKTEPSREFFKEAEVVDGENALTFEIAEK